MDVSYLSTLRSSNDRDFDEDKCRNVLVRYAGHICRNYNYQDGVPEVFLILREHMGDKTLDLAGGVLYELIEIDCTYSHEPGACFQRWRHDHMRRYDNLNLPHVPHMTTIMATVNPTARLVRWRREHAERYPFRLSDSSSRPLSFDSETSCIRTKKTWVIEHTLYASSRSEGTRPVSTIEDPAEFHKLQWKDDFGRGGKLVEEREIVTPSSPVSLDTKMDFPQDLQELKTASPAKKHRRWKSMFSLTGGSCPATIQRKKREGFEPGPKRRSRFSNLLAGFDTMLSLQAALELLQETMPMPHNCEIPNAVFARKHALVAEDQPIPPTVVIGFMETAESKAVGILSRTMSPLTRFRGPFTPQLGFDGGLDHRELYTVSVHPSRPRGLFADRPLFGEMKKILEDTGSSTCRPIESAGVTIHGPEDDMAMLRISSRFQPADWREGGGISTAHCSRRRFPGRLRREELTKGADTC